MSQERMKVLEMLESGKISTKEAESLLSAMEEAQTTDVAPGRSPRWLRIRVFDKVKDKVKANVNIPLALAGIAMKFIPKAAKQKMDEKGIDIDGILTQIRQGVTDGELVEIDTENESVSISLE